MHATSSSDGLLSFLVRPCGVLALVAGGVVGVFGGVAGATEGVRVFARGAATGAPGATWQFFAAASIAENGAVVARANLTGPDVTTSNGLGVWLGPPAAFELLARLNFGSTTPGDVVSISPLVSVDERGRALVQLTRATGLSPGTSVNVIDRFTPGFEPLRLFTEGGPAPEFGAGATATLSGQSLRADRSGAAALFVNLAVGGSTRRGVLALGADGVQRTAIAQTSIPQVVVLPDGSAEVLTLNNTLGEMSPMGATGVAFIGLLPPLVNGQPDRRVVLVGDGQVLRQVVRTGDPAPGTGSVFAEGIASLRGAGGRLAFTANYTGSSPTGGVFLWDGAAVSAVALANQAVPGAPAGTIFRSFGNGLSVSEDGHGVFVASFTPTPQGTGVSGTGVFRVSPGGTVSLIARSGTPAPGLPGSEVTNISSAFINNRGQVAFGGTLSGQMPFVAGFDPEQGLRMIVRSGQTLTLPGEGSVLVAGAGVPRLSNESRLTDRGVVLIHATVGGVAALLTGTVRLPCPADFNQDGGLDSDDLADFVACFFAAPEPCAFADVDGNGRIDPDDLADYIVRFFNEGC